MKQWRNLTIKELIKELEHGLNQACIAPDELQGSVILNVDQVQQLIDRVSTELVEYDSEFQALEQENDQLNARCTDLEEVLDAVSAELDNYRQR